MHTLWKVTQLTFQFLNRNTVFQRIKDLLKCANQLINSYHMIYQVHFKKERVVLELGQDFKLQRSEESQKKDKVSILIVLSS